MILSGVNLKQEFMGWLSKVGVQFLGIVDSLYRVGTNEMLWSMLARTENMTIIQGRVRLFFSKSTPSEENATTIITKIIVNYKIP